MTNSSNKTLIRILILCLFLSACGSNSSSDPDAQLLHAGNRTFSKIKSEILLYKVAKPTSDPGPTISLTTPDVIQVTKSGNYPTFLQFPAGGTETDITILDSASAYIFADSPWTCEAYKALTFSYGETGLLDITDFKTGAYFIKYSSCDDGGTYKLLFQE